MKMLDDIVLEYGDEEEIENYFEYCKKLNNAPAPGSFIICSMKLHEILRKIVDGL
jgi:hypothetical protein